MSGAARKPGTKSTVHKDNTSKPSSKAAAATSATSTDSGPSKAASTATSGATTAADDGEDQAQASGGAAERNAASPEPNCAICLGALENKSFTDSCFHMFCFVCLQEWSKVKAECPLCKQPFKSIIHNVKSYNNYDQFYLDRPAPAPRPMLHGWNFDRAFRYRTTLTMDHRYIGPPARPHPHPGPPPAHHGPLLHPCMYSRGLPSRYRFRTRRGEDCVSTSNFRRAMYVSGRRVTGVRSSQRRRTITPEFFRSNPAQTHRLMPWLNRELNALLYNADDQVTFVMELILDLIKRFPIDSEEFYEHIHPYLNDNTRHFMHEFMSFARSPYTMRTYDAKAVYETPAATTASNSDSSSSNNHDVVVVVDDDETEEPRRPAQGQGATSTLLSSILDSVLPPRPSWADPLGLAASGWDSPTPGPSWDVGQASSDSPVNVDALSDSEASTIIDPSYVAPDSPSGTARQRRRSPRDSDSDEVVFVSYDKPWADRSPIQLSSGEEGGVLSLWIQRLKQEHKKSGRRTSSSSHHRHHRSHHRRAPEEEEEESRSVPPLPMTQLPSWESQGAAAAAAAHRSRSPPHRYLHPDLQVATRRGQERGHASRHPVRKSRRGSPRPAEESHFLFARSTSKDKTRSSSRGSKSSSHKKRHLDKSEDTGRSSSEPRKKKLKHKKKHKKSSKHKGHKQSKRLLLQEEEEEDDGSSTLAAEDALLSASPSAGSSSRSANRTAAASSRSPRAAEGDRCKKHPSGHKKSRLGGASWSKGRGGEEEEKGSGGGDGGNRNDGEEGGSVEHNNNNNNHQEGSSSNTARQRSESTSGHHSEGTVSGLEGTATPGHHSEGTVSGLEGTATPGHHSEGTVSGLEGTATPGHHTEDALLSDAGSSTSSTGTAATTTTLTSSPPPPIALTLSSPQPTTSTGVGSGTEPVASTSSRQQRLQKALEDRQNAFPSTSAHISPGKTVYPGYPSCDASTSWENITQLAHMLATQATSSLTPPHVNINSNLASEPVCISTSSSSDDDESEGEREMMVGDNSMSVAKTVVVPCSSRLGVPTDAIDLSAAPPATLAALSRPLVVEEYIDVDSISSDDDEEEEEVASSECEVVDVETLEDSDEERDSVEAISSASEAEVEVGGNRDNQNANAPAAAAHGGGRSNMVTCTITEVSAEVNNPSPMSLLARPRALQPYTVSSFPFSIQSILTRDVFMGVEPSTSSYDPLGILSPQSSGSGIHTHTHHTQSVEDVSSTRSGLRSQGSTVEEVAARMGWRGQPSSSSSSAVGGGGGSSGGGAGGYTSKLDQLLPQRLLGQRSLEECSEFDRLSLRSLFPQQQHGESSSSSGAGRLDGGEGSGPRESAHSSRGSGQSGGASVDVESGQSWASLEQGQRAILESRQREISKGERSKRRASQREAGLQDNTCRRGTSPDTIRWREREARGTMVNSWNRRRRTSPTEVMRRRELASANALLRRAKDRFRRYNQGVASESPVDVESLETPDGDGASSGNLSVHDTDMLVLGRLANTPSETISVDDEDRLAGTISLDDGDILAGNLSGTEANTPARIISVDDGDLIAGNISVGDASTPTRTISVDSAEHISVADASTLAGNISAGDRNRSAGTTSVADRKTSAEETPVGHGESSGGPTRASSEEEARCSADLSSAEVGGASEEGSSSRLDVSVADTPHTPASHPDISVGEGDTPPTPALRLDLSVADSETGNSASHLSNVASTPDISVGESDTPPTPTSHLDMSVGDSETGHSASHRDSFFSERETGHPVSQSHMSKSDPTVEVPDERAPCTSRSVEGEACSAGLSSVREAETSVGGGGSFENADMALGDDASVTDGYVDLFAVSSDGLAEAGEGMSDSDRLAEFDSETERTDAEVEAGETIDNAKIERDGEERGREGEVGKDEEKKILDTHEDGERDSEDEEVNMDKEGALDVEGEEDADIELDQEERVRDDEEEVDTDREVPIDTDKKVSIGTSKEVSITNTKVADKEVSITNSKVADKEDTIDSDMSEGDANSPSVKAVGKDVAGRCSPVMSSLNTSAELTSLSDH